MKKKEKIQIVLICVILLLTVTVLIIRKPSEEGPVRITRPKNGSRETQLLLKTGETEKTIRLKVGKKEYTGEEADAIYRETIQILESMLNPGNSEEIVLSESLKLPKTVKETGVKLRWSTSDEEIVKDDGTLCREAVTEETTVILQARMTFGEETREHWFYAKVLPYAPGSSERLFYNAQKELERIEEGASEKAGFYLPEKVGEVEIMLPRKETHPLPLLISMAVLLPVVIWLAKKQEKEKAEKEREQIFMAAYPKVVTKLTLYTGAGMSLRGAWERIAGEYRKRTEQSGIKEVVYEEILRLAGELKNGMSESGAYEAYGRRINYKPYVRLAALLINRLEKGSSGLREGLEAEVRLAWENHREQVVKAGEEAQTKLLLPMMGMLFLVLAIVMIPAFFNMGI